jgi:hypothetical protein
MKKLTETQENLIAWAYCLTSTGFLFWLALIVLQ